MATISQDLFDETLLENQEAFDLSPEEALAETIGQFSSQLGVTAKNDGKNDGPLAHLVLLHPSTDEGQSLRRSRCQFQNNLNTLDQCVNSDGTVSITNRDEVLSALKEVGTQLQSDALPHLHIFRTTSSIYTFMSFLSVDSDDVLLGTIQTLIVILAKNDCEKCNAIKVQLKDVFVSTIGRLVSQSDTYINRLENDETVENIMVHLLQLATLSTKNCEVAKVNYVQSKGVATISSHLKLNNRPIIEAASNLLASLCRYDDFREHSGPLGSAANTSSAHDHALEFHRAGVEERLVEIAVEALAGLQDNKEESDRLVVAVVTALRVLAVNDDIIQTMVALGVLPMVTKALELGCNENGTNETNESEQSTISKSRLASSALGLLRNLCGNDEIKTNLCLGSCDQTSAFSTPSCLPHIIHAMKLYPTVAILQEHACGTLAAMALRRPANAHRIIDQDGPRYILSAMKRHDRNPSVQRQGALAIRNIASRLLRDCPEDGEKGKEERNAIRDSFLELGAEDILRNITGLHQGSVDEAYAALRDLGCTVQLVKFSGEGSQEPSRTMMFGEKHNTNFRPVFDDSAGLEKGMDEAISKFQP